MVVVRLIFVKDYINNIELDVIVLRVYGCLHVMLGLWKVVFKVLKDDIPLK